MIKDPSSNVMIHG